MAYGNYAPFYRTGYFNPAPAPMPMVQEQYVPQYQQAQNDMTWVLNETEANSWPVAPNNSVTLWDKSQPTIYVKSVSSNGVPSMRILDFTERTVQGAQKAQEQTFEYGDNFVSKEDFKALQGDFEALKGKVEALQNRKTKKAEVENE